jgi:hypothetical protein
MLAALGSNDPARRLQAREKIRDTLAANRKSFRVVTLMVGVARGCRAEIATRAEEMLVEAGVEIFQRAGCLVRPVTADAAASRGRRTKVANLFVVNTVYMRDLLWRCHTSDRQGQSVRCPEIHWRELGARASPSPPIPSAVTRVAARGDVGVG